MKALIKFVLILVMSSTAVAQVVQACFSINGIPNTASKTISLCPGNFELRQNNCSATPGNASWIQYAWENITTSQTFSEGPSNINSVGTEGVWVGKMHYNDGVKDTTSTDTVTVTFYVLPSLSLSLTGTSGLFNYSAPNAIKCLLSTGTFNVLPNNLVSYEWFCNTVNPNTPLSNTTSLFMNANNSVASPYRVEAIDNNGCKSTYSFNIGISSAPDIGLNQTTIGKCLNNTTTIEIKNDSLNTGTYAWYSGFPTPNTSMVTGANINPIYLVDGGVDLIAPLDTFPLPTTDTRYMLRFTNFLCPAQDTAFVNILTPPVVSARPDTAICYGGIARLTGKVVSGGSGNFAYSWSEGTANDTAYVNPTTNITYTFTVKDNGSCGFADQTDQVQVLVNPQLFLTASNDTTICRYPLGAANLSANLTGGAVGAKSYSWLPVLNLSNPAIANPIANPSTTRTYTVTATDAANCSLTESVIVTSYTPAIGSINDPDMVSEGEPYVYDVGVSGNNGFTFVWTDLSAMIVVSNTSEFEAKYQGVQDTVEYQIVVTDPSNGCTITDTATVRYISNNKILYVPNIFSPGAEFEDNRKLKVFADNISPNGFRFTIFNKWGQIVFETTEVQDAREGWDGGPQIEGVYTYVMEGKFNNGADLTENEEYMGYFKLSK